MSNVTPEFREELREAFKIFDKDGDGRITAIELEGILRSLGEKNATAADAREMVSRVDRDGDGTIDFEEFVELMATSKSSTDEEMLAAFKVFDEDGNGTINIDELRKVMKKLGEKVTEDQLKEMIKAADINGDGLIDYHEFVKMMKADLK
eukprot:TRINITY_DN4865_c0_g2_i1.p1 TRINITY_DN4865_c0_g2~~TRINITY_DN4865_c0_g2_i1.p1  ORF type:complete len:150 (+),score=44.91 TRINITY_DN4865_c0_g2_i1:149-598(+)